MAPWKILMWSLMTDVCRAMGVRTDVPFRELTEAEKTHRLRRSGGKKAYLLPPKKLQRRGRAGLHLFLRRPHGGERPVQGQGREGHEAGGEIFEGGSLPRLRRHPPVGGRPGSPAPGHWPGRGLPDDPDGAGELGGGGARLPARGDAAHGREHLPVLPGGGPAAHGAGAGLPHPGPLGGHPVHRGAAADAAGPGGAQPDHRGAVRAGRALHRPPPGQHRGPDGGDGRPGGRRQLRASGGPRHTDLIPRPLAHRDGTQGGGGGRPGTGPGDGCRRGGGPRLPDRALSGRRGQGPSTAAVS